MEKKNTVLLTVIAVATLLVAVVGATFAYFTATTTADEGVKNNANVTTAEVSSVKLNVVTASSKNSWLNYPGGFGYAGIKVNAAKLGDAQGEYTLSYNVNLSLKNTTQTSITWKLYKSTTALTDTRTCSLTQDITTVPGETHYFYTCSGENNYGTAVDGASGTLAAEMSSAETKKIAQTLSTDAGEVYYYLVVDYQDTKTSQNEDQGDTITAEITGVSDVTAVQKQ